MEKSKIEGPTIRKVLLEVINEYANRGPNFQSNSILSEASMRLGLKGIENEQALLTLWYDLFRTGHLSWGYNLSNPDAPFCHLTEDGRTTLENLSRDPANTEGYLSYLRKTITINPIANSYIIEALETYNSNCVKAAAVMIGVALESVILELRDELINRLDTIRKKTLKDLTDWRIKRVLDAIKAELDSQKNEIPERLYETIESYWSAFTYQIRTVRNDAGHPTSLEPVTSETVHASLLILPELFKLIYDIKDWIISRYPL